MRHDYLDRYSRLDSPIHRQPAVVKLVVALALLVATISLRPALLPVAVVLLATTLLSRLPPRFVLLRLLLLEPFALGVALLALFQPGGGRIFAFLIAKSTLCLLTMILLSNTTPFSEILRVLRRARVPALLITTLALMYRYLFVLVDEAERMKRARASRTLAWRRRFQWKNVATVAGQLFIRSTERAERIYAAMCARGWR
ncbi:MAG TPA: cobalt ECF transporter T component CbiQ [Verrucomicrobiae bacterium]|nr:cobalt ECF transporter T component CbiQ [Verrucomicrobiae bacterium]